jgi:hypothetical protein
MGNSATLRLFVILEGSGARGYVFSGEEAVLQNSFLIPLVYTDWGEYEKRAMVSLESSLRDLHTQLGRGTVIPESITILIGSPWSMVYPRYITHSKKKPFIVDSEKISMLVNNEIDHISKTQLDTKRIFDTKNAAIFDTDITEISLNGYVFPDPAGKETKEIGIRLSFGVAPIPLITHIVRLCDGVFGLEPEFRMYHGVLSRSVAQRAPSGIVVSVNRDGTDLFEFASSSPRSIHSFPLGYRHLIQHLSHRLSRPLLEAENILSLYGKDSLEERFRRRITSHIVGHMEEWMEEVDKIVTQAYIDTHNDLILHGEHPSVSVYKTVLESGVVPSGSFGRKKPTIHQHSLHSNPKSFWSLGKTIH